MLRMTIIPGGNTYPLPIPANYVGQTLEVLLYSATENAENKVFCDKKPSDFFGTLSADEGENFQNYITNSRLEWDRNI